MRNYINFVKRMYIYIKESWLELLSWELII